MRAGIVGFGRTGMAHYRSYCGYGVEVVAVCGRTPESTKEKLDRAGISAEALSLGDLLARNDIDVVSICTPPECHAVQTVFAATAGKHLIIEKPLALRPEGLNAMDEAVTKSGVKTGTSFVWRWTAGVEAIRRRRDELGDVIHVRADFWNGRKRPRPPDASGVVMGTMGRTGCHAVDMVVCLAGRATSVRALGTPQTMALLVAFENGSTATVVSSDEACRPMGFGLSVSGTQASLDLLPDGTLLYSREGSSKQWPLLPARREPYRFDTLPFMAMMREFLHDIEQGKDTSANFPHARHVHEICFAAEHSALRGGEVVDI